MSGDKLYGLFKTIAQRAVPSENMTDLLYGQVKSISPLRIEIENKYTIEKDQLFLSPLCIRKTIQVDTKPVIVTVEVWRGLQVGDKVVMLRHDKGQGFYVLQRAGDLT